MLLSPIIDPLFVVTFLLSLMVEPSSRYVGALLIVSGSEEIDNVVAGLTDRRLAVGLGVCQPSLQLLLSLELSKGPLFCHNDLALYKSLACHATFALSRARAVVARREDEGKDQYIPRYIRFSMCESTNRLEGRRRRHTYASRRKTKKKIRRSGNFLFYRSCRRESKLFNRRLISFIASLLHGKNDFAKVSKNLGTYGGENNFVEPPK
ncbi:hypothetical protein ALC57_17503 [Trachymyrmex cornetzi]|uniref:Uncharacterized protein n=1 Tax=Trachymyrmex cornetzi TaxID=471704 RepID=A0A195DBR6_9HYME|nr:hypothetical protein ALC57_17503 [Trachymyrmex cornetzi]